MLRSAIAMPCKPTSTSKTRMKAFRMKSPGMPPGLAEPSFNIHARCTYSKPQSQTTTQNGSRKIRTPMRSRIALRRRRAGRYRMSTRTWPSISKV